MKKKMSKTKKQILALGMLALGGLSLGSLTFIPYLLRHWSTIQYEIVNFKSEFNQNEKKFTLGFELSDLDAYKLKYQPLQVKLYSDSKGKTMVSEHTAHYDDFSRSWKLDVDASKLTPGSRYYIGIDYKEGKTRFGAKKIVGFSKNVADFINVPAAVKSINFGKIDTGSAAVKVDFSDDIKSLEGKKVALEYYYLPKGQKVAAKDQVVTTYVDLTTVKEGAADFQLNNLLPDADYYVSGVKLISDGQTPRELTSAEQENIQLSEGSFFNTEIINLKVNKMKASDELDLGKFVLLTFDKTTNPQLAKVNNMPVEISYVNRTSKEHEIKVIRTTLVDNVISFHLNRANNHLLPLGSSFEIAQIKIAGANVEFDKGVSNVFYSQNGIVAIKSKTSGTTANVETTFASQDDISGLTANVDLSPLAEHKVSATIVPLENNLYKATFNISGLTNKTVYNINSISLDKLPANTVFAGGEFDYRKFNFEEGVQRSFLTGINDLSVFIKAAPQIETNLVTYSFGFGSQSNYLNSKQLRLAYHLDGDGHTYYSGVATAAGNAVNFKLNEFLPGRKYHLDNIEIIGEPNINVVIDGDQTYRDFYTRAIVSDIQFENIGETSAKAKVFIKSDLEQWKKIADNDAGKVTLVYSAGAHNALVASTDINFEPNKLVKKDDGFELEFNLTGLNRKTNYYIDNLIFGSPNTTTLFSGANIVSLDKFFTTKFENASALSVNTYNVSQNKATVEIQFNPDTDSFLDGHKFRLVLKKNDQVINSGPGSETGSTEGNSTKDDVYVAEVKSSTIRFDLTGLDAGSKYTVANLVSVGETGQDATQFSNLKFNFENPSVKSQTSFYTDPDITSIETTFPKEQEAKVVVHLASQKPDLNYANGISLAYLNKTTKVLEFATGSFDKSKKEFAFELGKTNPLQKVTDYEIQRIVAEQHEIPFAKTFNEENKKFSTSAQTAQIIAVQQVGHSVNEIKAVLNFSNNDTYLNGETLQVKLNKHTGGGQAATAIATVKNNSAEFDFKNLTDAGVQYSIGQITHTTTNGGRVTKKINFNYDRTAVGQKDKLYTLGEIKTITYGQHKEPHNATVTVSFTDAESFLSTNPTTKTPRTAILKYKDDSKNHFSASAQINSGSVTFNLSNLKEFTQYTVESLEISQINGQIQFSRQVESQKNFYTKVATISLNDVIYTNKTPTNSEVTLVFDSGDKKVIDHKQVNVTLEQKTGQTKADKQAHANISFNSATNRYEAKLDFNGLTSGVRYDLKTLTIGQTKDDPSAQETSTITVDTKKITTEHKNSFATTGVVEHIRLDGQASDRQARITIQFQGDTTDQVAGFQGRSATLVYQNIATKQLVSDTQTISNNSATFTLSNLAKQQTYKFVSLKLDGITDIEKDNSKTGVNEVEQFTTSFASVEIIDIQQKVENDKTVVTVFFNPDIDEVAINNYQATLEYTPKGENVQKTSQQVNIENFRAVFNLEDDILKEVSAFDINAVTLSPKPSGASRSRRAAPPAVPTANFSNLLNTTYADKKIFYSAPKITEVQKTVTDNTANLTIKVNQPENTYTGNDVDALLVFKSTRTGTTDVKLIKATSTQIRDVEKTFNFDLTGLDKFTNYEIEELRLNGNIIKFNNDIKAHIDKKQFKTTATTVETPSFVQTIKKKNEVAANISFDPVKDWYLVGNKVSFNANINGQAKTFEAVVGSDGLAKLDITSDAASNFTVAPGENIAFNTISVVDDKNLGLQNKGTLVNPATFKNDDVSSAAPSPLTLKSKDLITSVVQKTLSTNNAQIELKLATSDRLSGELTLNYLNKQDGSVKQVKVQAPTQPSNGDVTFNITGTDKVSNLVDYQLQSVEANGETIGFDTDAVTIPDREFRTLPNSVNVTNITTTYNKDTETAVAKVEFDETARQFLVGKKVKLLYQPFLHSLASNKSEATVGTDGQEATIRPDGTVEFKLDGTLAASSGHAGGDITIAGVPGRAPGGSTTTNTYSSNPTGNSTLNLVNRSGKLIDGIKYQFTGVEVLDSGINSFRTTTNLTVLDHLKFSTLPISAYAYQVQTTEQLDKVQATIEAFYLTNEPLNADAATAQKFAISLYNQTNNTVAEAKAKTFEQATPSVVALNLGATAGQQGQQYFWKITYQVDLEKASLYKIVSTSYDGKDVPLSRYTDATSGQSADNQLKQYFTTPGTKTKVVGIEYDPIPFDDKATIKVKLDDVDGFVSKNNLQLKLSYEQKAGAGMVTGGAAQQIQTIDNTGSITSDGVATFELTSLQRASQYEIKKIELVGHDAINTGEGLKIETVARGSQLASDFTFRSQTTNAANQTLFATRNQVTNIQFQQTSRTDGAGTLTVTFGQTGNQVAVDKGIVTFVDTSTGTTTHQEILANSASVFNNSNHSITFSLNNLKKIGTYRVEKVSIHGLDYFVAGTQSTFSTIPQVAKITNIQYSDLASNLDEADNKLYGSGKIKVTFDSLENYLDGQTLRFTLRSKSGNITKNVSGLVQQDPNSNPYVDLTLDKQNFESTDSTNPNIVVGREWEIQSVNISNKQVTAKITDVNELNNVTFPLTGAANSGGVGQSLEQLKEFQLPGYFSNVTLAQADSHTSSSIKLQSVQFSGDISKFQGKQVVLELDKNQGHEYFATANVSNGNTLSFDGLALDGLTGLTAYKVKSIKIDGVSYPISPNTNTTNIAYTNVEHFTVTNFEWEKTQSNHNTSVLKVTFDSKDSWLLNKKVELKYKSASDSQTHTLTAVKQTINNTTGKLEATFSVDVNNLANAYNNSFDYGKQYEFMGVDLTDFDPRSPEFQPYDQHNVPTAIYASSLGMGSEAVRFYTEYAAPTIRSTSVSGITNTEGQLNTFKATVTIRFNNNGAIAPNNVDTWNINFFKKYNFLPDEQINTDDKFRIINKRWDNRTYSFSFDLFGDLRDIIDNFQNANPGRWDPSKPNDFYMQISYTYFKNPLKTEINNNPLTQNMSDGTLLNANFPKEYVEITKIRGTQTTAYDYGIEMEVYDPFNIIKVTPKEHDVVYDELYNSIYNNGNSNQNRSGTVGAEPDGITANYFNNLRDGNTKNQSRINKIQAANATFYGDYVFPNSKFIQMDLRVANIDKDNQSIMNFKNLSFGQEGDAVKQYVTKIPSPLYPNSNFRSKVRMVDTSKINSLKVLEPFNSNGTSNIFSILDVSYYNKQSKQYLNNSQFSNYKKIWFNVSPSNPSNLAGKALVLDLNSIAFLDNANDVSHSRGIDFLIPKNSDELQRVFIMPTSWNHIDEYWGTYTNQPNQDDRRNSSLQVTIDYRRDFLYNNHNKYNEETAPGKEDFTNTLRNNVILGPSPFLAPFKDHNTIISYYDVKENPSGHHNNRIPIYNYGNLATSDAHGTLYDDSGQPVFITNNYEKPFGITNMRYDEQTGHLSVTFDWADGRKNITTIMPHKAYAAFVDNDGYMYYFGKTNGDGASFDEDLSSTNKTIIFSTKQPLYDKSDEKPKLNSRLFFVGILVQPYIIDKTNSNFVVVKYNADQFGLNLAPTRPPFQKYRSDAYRKVTAIPGVFDYYKAFTLSRSYPVPILTKAAQDSLHSIVYKG